MAPLSPVVGRSTQVETSDVGERVVLYHRGTGKSLVLNPTGAWLWRQMETPMPTAELVGRLRQQFPDLAADMAQRDVETYLRALAEHEALR